MLPGRTPSLATSCLTRAAVKVKTMTFPIADRARSEPQAALIVLSATPDPTVRLKKLKAMSRSAVKRSALGMLAAFVSDC